MINFLFATVASLCTFDRRRLYANIPVHVVYNNLFLATNVQAQATQYPGAREVKVVHCRVIRILNGSLQ